MEVGSDVESASFAMRTYGGGPTVSVAIYFTSKKRFALCEERLIVTNRHVLVNKLELLKGC